VKGEPCQVSTTITGHTASGATLPLARIVPTRSAVMASSSPSAAGIDTSTWVTPVTSVPHSARKASEPASAPASWTAT
jgi:hypothetical protein